MTTAILIIDKKGYPEGDFEELDVRKSGLEEALGDNFISIASYKIPDQHIYWLHLEKPSKVFASLEGKEDENGYEIQINEVHSRNIELVKEFIMERDSGIDLFVFAVHWGGKAKQQLQSPLKELNQKLEQNSSDYLFSYFGSTLESGVYQERDVSKVGAIGEILGLVKGEFSTYLNIDDMKDYYNEQMNFLMRLRENISAQKKFLKDPAMHSELISSIDRFIHLVEDLEGEYKVIRKLTHNS